MTNQLNHLQAVTDALVKRGYKATMEYPGFIQVLAHGLRFDFGTANDKWDGDVEADDHSGVVHTSVPSTSTDVEAIADALAVAIESCKPGGGMIRRGDIVTYKPEWRDAGDEGITFVAIEDEEDGRVLVEAQLGLPINPTQLVAVHMIEGR